MENKKTFGDMLKQLFPGHTFILYDVYNDDEEDWLLLIDNYSSDIYVDRAVGMDYTFTVKEFGETINNIKTYLDSKN